MRILWHSAAPWEPTGYGTQTAIWTRYLRACGHDVVISAYHGIAGRTSSWNMVPVWPCPLAGGAHDLLPYWARKHEADLVIILGDLWTVDPRLLKGLNVAAWVPVDTTPLSLLDMTRLLQYREVGVRPIAMSDHGEDQLRAAGFDPLYVPHGIDCQKFVPVPDARRAAIASGAIPPGAFVVGINANNIDPVRKGLGEQFQAFARLRERHPESLLMVHSMVSVAGSADLGVMAGSLGIKEHVRFADQDRMQAGTFDQAHMIAWYNCLDVLSNCSYGEGFGLTAVEAQACGTPVVLPENTTGEQLLGAGWLAGCQPFWNWTHNSWWQAPIIDEVDGAYEAAWVNARRPKVREKARRFAESYDIGRVEPLWDAAIKALTP